MMFAGLDVYFREVNPEAHAALPDSQNTAIAVVMKKSYRNKELTLETFFKQ